MQLSEHTLQPCTLKLRGPPVVTCGSDLPLPPTQGLSLPREKPLQMRPSLRLQMVPRYLQTDPSILPLQLGRTLFVVVLVYRL